MARNTRAKKQPEAPKVDIGAEIFASLRELEKVKGMVPVDEIKSGLTTRKAIKVIVDNAIPVAPKAAEASEE